MQQQRTPLSLGAAIAANIDVSFQNPILFHKALDRQLTGSYEVSLSVVMNSGADAVGEIDVVL